MGTVSILNVGAGDTKITFDKSSPADTIRAGRIIKDMLRHGYALLVEVERDGVKAYERALDFDESTSEYIIADLDPIRAAIERKRAREAAEKELSKPLSELVGGAKEEEHGQSEPVKEEARPASDPAPRRRGRLPSSSTRAVAVGRSAGG